MLPALIAGAAISAANLGLSAWQSHKADQARRTAQRDIDRWQGTAQGILDDAYKSGIRLSGENDVQNYQRLRDSFDPSNFIYNADPFDKSKYRVEDYLNENRGKILDDVQNRIQHTAAGGALGHSSGVVEDIAQGLIDKDEQLYKDARDAMNQDRTFDYGMYTDYIQQQQNNLNTLMQGYQTQMSNLRGDITFDQQQKDNYTQNLLNLGNATMQAKASLV